MINYYIKYFRLYVFPQTIYLINKMVFSKLLYFDIYESAITLNVKNKSKK